MTRKNYILLAGALASERPSEHWIAKYQQWVNDCRSLAYHLSNNPRFNATKFLEACGIK